MFIFLLRNLLRKKHKTTSKDTLHFDTTNWQDKYKSKKNGTYELMCSPASTWQEKYGKLLRGINEYVIVLFEIKTCFLAKVNLYFYFKKFTRKEA